MSIYDATLCPRALTVGVGANVSDLVDELWFAELHESNAGESHPSAPEQEPALAAAQVVSFSSLCLQDRRWRLADRDIQDFDLTACKVSDHGSFSRKITVPSLQNHSSESTESTS